MSPPTFPLLDVPGDALRRVAAQFATGVTVVTVRASSGRPLGMTVSAFACVSLEPPLILACVHRTARAAPALLAAAHFGVNILGAGQRTLASRFASCREDRFESVEHDPGHTGIPVIRGVLGILECRLERVITGGDHWILLGRVVAADAATGEPLVHFAGAYRPSPS